MKEFICPFCNKTVKTEEESLLGCRECVEFWAEHGIVDHDTG